MSFFDPNFLARKFGGVKGQSPLRSPVYLWELVRIHTGGIAHEHAEMVCRAGEAPAPTVFRFDFVGAVSPDEKG